MNSETKNKIDLLVIGAGPGGYSSAFKAADQGLDVVLVDENPDLGGVCLNRGCIPSKALLHIAKVIYESREVANCGVEFAPPVIDLEKLREWKIDVVNKMGGGLVQLAQQRKVRVISGRARFLDSHSVEVENTGILSFSNCIIATGSRPILPDLFQEAGSALWDSTSALNLSEIPQRLLVVGGGYIGLELGSVYSALGSCVTVVEKENTLLAGVDADLVRPLQRRLDQIFDSIRLNTCVAKVEPEGSGVKVTLTSDAGEKTEYHDKMLISVGRVPNSGNLGLENTAVQLDSNGFVQVNAARQTQDDSIYAIGDVVGGPLLAHKASHEAQTAVDSILEKNISHEIGLNPIPAVIFTDPEIAFCGLTEAQAKADKIEYRVARFPWSASGKAQSIGCREGVSKLIIDSLSGKILGMGIVGSGAGELIGEGVLAIHLGATVGDLAHTIHPHPTLSETLSEAAQTDLGEAVHIYKRSRR
jgi:dihydrolipoamide dehydrogenase